MRPKINFIQYSRQLTKYPSIKANGFKKLPIKHRKHRKNFDTGDQLLFFLFF